MLKLHIDHIILHHQIIILVVVMMIKDFFFIPKANYKLHILQIEIVLVGEGRSLEYKKYIVIMSELHHHFEFLKAQIQETSYKCDDLAFLCSFLVIFEIRLPSA